MTITIPYLATKAGSYQPELEIRYQGCKKNLCYMPQKDRLRFKVSVSEKPSQKKATQKKPTSTDKVKSKQQSTEETKATPVKPILKLESVEIKHVAASTRGGLSVYPTVLWPNSRADGKPHPLVARLIQDKLTATPGERYG